MRPFTHFDARTIKEACKLLAQYDGRAVLNAGGTDLIGTLKGENLFAYPEALVNIKTIAGLDQIREDKGVVRIGALVRLSDLANSPLLSERYGVLAEAARAVGIGCGAGEVHGRRALEQIDQGRLGAQGDHRVEQVLRQLGRDRDPIARL